MIKGPSNVTLTLTLTSFNLHQWALFRFRQVLPYGLFSVCLYVCLSVRPLVASIAVEF